MSVDRPTAEQFPDRCPDCGEKLFEWAAIMTGSNAILARFECKNCGKEWDMFIKPECLGVRERTVEQKSKCVFPFFWKYLK
jgi:transposase-like protein